MTVTSMFGTVRVRATVASMIIVAIAMTIAGMVLLDVLRSSQLDSVDATLELRAKDIEAIIDRDSGIAQQGGIEKLSDDDEEDGFVQIVTESGEVIASSPNISGRAPIVADDGDSRLSMSLPEVDEHDFRVRVRATDSDPQLVIVVGANLENVDDVLATTRRSLIIGLPALLLLIGVMIWLVIGRALRPVEAIRSEVADIGGGGLDRRVPEPGTNDEIGRLARTMNAMLDRLEAADVAQTQFVSDASHELRTPIAVIRHELEVALRSDDDVMLREIAVEVLDEDLRMQRLVEDLLLLARRDGRADEGHRIKRTLVDLDDIALGEARRVRTDKKVVTSGISAGQVRGDPDQLLRVVRNLLDNAIRHADTTVAVDVASTGDGRVVLSVDDDGDGVAETDRRRIFERFGRLDEARSRDEGGSGLGLAIVAGLVADHGGTVTVETSPTLGGARFVIAFSDARF